MPPKLRSSTNKGKETNRSQPSLTKFLGPEKTHASTSHSVTLSEKMADGGSPKEQASVDLELESGSSSINNLVLMVNNFKSEMSKTLDEFQTKLFVELNELKGDVKANNEKCNENNRKLRELEKSLDFTQNQCDSEKTRVTSLERENIKLQAEIHSYQQELQLCEDKLKRLEDYVSSKLIEMERHSREYNLRLLGVKEEKNENCLELLTEQIQKIFPEKSVVEIKHTIENAHRTGKAIPNRDRHIIAKLHSRPIRNEILRKAKISLNKENQGVIRIIEDLTKTDYELKKKANKQMNEAFKEKKKVRFWKGKLFIDGEVVKIEEKKNG